MARDLHLQLGIMDSLRDQGRVSVSKLLLDDLSTVIKAFTERWEGIPNTADNATERPPSGRDRVFEFLLANANVATAEGRRRVFEQLLHSRHFSDPAARRRAETIAARLRRFYARP